MPNPDLVEYHDLTLYDRDATELVDRALLDAMVNLPGWVPREGNTEVVLLQALALTVSELVYAINRVPSAVVEVLMRLYGITRLEGALPSADVTFTLADDAGHEVPIGTTVRLDLGGDEAPVDFTLDEGIVVAAGSTTGTAPATGTRNTAAANGTPAGTVLELRDSVLFVEVVELDTAVAAGADPETDAEWRDRAIARFARLSEALVLPDHFSAAALDFAFVERATAIDNYDGTGTPAGTDLGHITVAVLGSGGAVVAVDDKAELEADLEARALANLDVHVIDALVTAVNVTANVIRKVGYDHSTVFANVEAALELYLDPDTWPWRGKVWPNEILTVIDAAEGVERVVSVTVPAAGGQDLAGGGATATGYGLPTLGVLNLTSSADPGY